MSRFSNRLRELRTANNMSQRKLATAVNISKSSINMYERGEREPGIELLEAFADYFNVDMDYLLGKKDTPRENLSEKTKPGNAELEENIIIYNRNGKIIKKKMSKEKMEMLSSMLDAIPEDDNPDL